MSFCLQTPRLILREMTHVDFPALCAMLQDPAVIYAWEHAFSDDEVRAWIDRNLQRYREHGYGYWLVQSHDGQPLGQVGLLPETIHGQPHLGVGWILPKNSWHHGYATEAAAACLHHAFHTLNAPRVIADIRPENLASIRVAERLNMRPNILYDKPVGDRTLAHRVYLLRTPVLRVVPCSADWPRHFAALAQLLAPLLTRFNARLEHVGSTSVPGLHAKPVIDADIILPDAAPLPEFIQHLQTAGFFHRGDLGFPGREAFDESIDLPFLHNLYVCRPDATPLRNHLLLRDYLRNHPADVARYGALKLDLATRHPNDIDAYCSAKSDLIAELLLRAGMPASDVDAIRALNRR